jgi:hypothetical protein
MVKTEDVSCSSRLANGDDTPPRPQFIKLLIRQFTFNFMYSYSKEKAVITKAVWLHIKVSPVIYFDTISLTCHRLARIGCTGIPCVVTFDLPHQ